MACVACLLTLAAATQASAASISWWYGNESAASPDGRHLYVSGHRTMSFSLDPATGAASLIGHTEPGGPESQIAVAPDGRHAYTTGEGAIHVLARDPDSGLLTHHGTYTGERTATTHRLRSIHDIAISRDGRHVYVTERSPTGLTVLERDPATGLLTERQSFYEGPLGYALELALAPDDRSLYVSGGGVGIWSRDTATGLLSPVRMQDTGGSAFAVAVAPDGRRVYAGMTGYSVYDREETGDLALVAHADMTYPSCRGCGNGAFISVAPDNGAVFSVDDRGPRIVQGTPHPTEGATLARTHDDKLGSPRSMSWSPDGRLAFVMYDVPGSLRHDVRMGIYRRTEEGIELAHVVGPELEVPDFNTKHHRAAISIEDGALYTNGRDVDVTISTPGGGGSLRLSNVEGDFEASPFLRLSSTDQVFPWRLATSGPGRSVKRVYVRFTGSGGGAFDLFDDIVLDEQPPELLSARVRDKRLVVRARDNRSGVKRIQLATSRKKPGKSRAFSTRTKLPGGSKPVHVRVIDGAGNPSKWRTARRP